MAKCPDSHFHLIFFISFTRIDDRQDYILESMDLNMNLNFILQKKCTKMACKTTNLVGLYQYDCCNEPYRSQCVAKSRIHHVFPDANQDTLVEAPSVRLNQERNKQIKELQTQNIHLNELQHILNI